MGRNMTNSRSDAAFFLSLCCTELYRTSADGTERPDHSGLPCGKPATRLAHSRGASPRKPKSRKRCRDNLKCKSRVDARKWDAWLACRLPSILEATWSRRQGRQVPT